MCREWNLSDYDKIIDLTKDTRVELGSGYSKLLDTWLQLGMSRYVCRNGTLSDSQEVILPVKRYTQAIKEMYYLASNIKAQKALAMEAQADLMDANEELKMAVGNSDRLRAEAKKIKAESKLESALVTIQDQMRMLDEFNKVREELEPEVTSKYSCIEDAEKDHWESVAKYRHLKKQMGYSENLTHVPLDMDSKATLGLELQSPDLMAWAIVADQKKMATLVNRHEEFDQIQNTGALHG